ncbi:hypothetical protein [Paenibacillus tianjinensis]|uniref:Uncharacterized protein n=1 Tax=Paenibacillus tianjinensis TaxID=2810347 RepID=A0ABX7LEL4_9BACL|nr:hypothetical protein [Paenibacillus tianjinensis]QSF46545.1 hypothetical protein JRJ22_08225 [Paenibacillus tianjinensis]
MRVSRMSTQVLCLSLLTLTVLLMIVFSGCSLLHKEKAGGPLSHEINEQEDVVYSHGFKRSW